MKRDAASLAARIKRWQSRLDYLGIGHWRVSSVDITCNVPGRNANSEAAVWFSSDYDTARFTFNDEFMATCTPQQLDETIIHEWLHVAQRDIDVHVRLVEERMAASEFDTFDAVFDHLREGHIERLARQLYAFHTKS